jgi:glutamate/tyrosine decarboxylase-like PLP-dependent enzyme
MTEEQITRHIHENKDARPDSIEIGTAGKGGVLKVYFNLATMSEPDIRALINKGLSARQYASGGLSQ